MPTVALLKAVSLALLWFGILLVTSEPHTVSINTKPPSSSSGGSDTSVVATDFVATDSWQTVEPGQKIPPGLHVRMNMQTGETEARLMESSPDAATSSEAKRNLPIPVNTPAEAAVAAEEAAAVQAASERLRQALSSREVKEALKKIKAENLPPTENQHQQASSFRSYEELKADFTKLNANVKTDLEILKDLLAEWNSTEKACLSDCRLGILADFEYHLRQIDNAQNFVQLGGLDLLMDVVNGSDAATAAAGLRALAAACQGNSPVQVAALKTGFLPVLLRVLEHSGQQPQLRSLCVLALASMCRHFPHAQALLIKSGGLAALRSAFLSRDSDRQRALRIVTLLADLTLEATEAAEGSERKRQYDQIGAGRAIAETGWCQLVTRLLPDESHESDPESAATLGHDAAEKTVVAMETLADACAAEFSANAEAVASLRRMSRRYTALAQAELAEEGSAGYFGQLSGRIAGLLKRLAMKTEL